jgi:hypothetical protein
MEGINGFRKIGNYEISQICLQSYPCQHSIKFENGENKRMYADNIYRLFKSEGLSDPHIDSYAEFVRQCDFPTPEEIQKRKDDQLIIQQASKKREEQYAEQETIIKQYKASSRLDKLKQKNNIY